jgi:hypothetical protein
MVAPRFHARRARDERTGRTIALSELIDAPMSMVRGNSAGPAGMIWAAQMRGLSGVYGDVSAVSVLD